MLCPRVPTFPVNLSTIDPLLSPETASAPSVAAPSARQLHLLHGLAILLVAVVITRVMWAPALLAGHSAGFDLARMVTFHTAIRAGDFFPLWSPDLYHGYGSPLFQFYAPLAYYFTEILVLAGADVPTALKITQVLALFASGLAMYALAVRHLSAWAACLGAVLYMAAPYRLLDIFVRHALAEHCAFVWLPLLVLGTERFLSEKSRAGLVTGFIATVGLTLTHNVTALIGLPPCVLAGWMLSQRPRTFSSLLLAAAPAALGLGAAAFFWWPALSGRAFTAADDTMVDGYYDFHRHFVEASRFLDPSWGFGENGPDAANRMSLQIGWPHLLAAVGALLLLLLDGRGKSAAARTRWSLVGVTIFAGAIFLCHQVSQPIWDALPLVQFVQFPWRFLGFAVFGAALCGAVLLDRAGTAWPRLEMPLGLVALSAVLLAYYPFYAEARFLAVDTRSSNLIHATPALLDALESAGVLTPIANLVTPESIRATGERATAVDDFLPRGVQQKPTAPPAAPLSTDSGTIHRWTRPGHNRYTAEVTLPTAGQVTLRQFWFPGWTATVDARPVPTTPLGATAVVSCEVPAGQHVVEFSYRGLPQRRAGFIASVLSFVLAAAITSRLPRQKGVHA